MIVLLAIAGGSIAYSVRFYESGEYGISLFFLLTFFVSGLGVSINFQEINNIKKDYSYGIYYVLVANWTYC